MKTRILVFILILSGSLVAAQQYKQSNEGYEPGAVMSYREMIGITTKGKSDVYITVGILENDKSAFTVYGKNAAVVEPVEYCYEIGSITKVFTTALLCKALSENRLALSDPIDKYVDNLPEARHYPTIEQLATHTSGYGNYLDFKIIFNTLLGINPYLNYSIDDLQRNISVKKIEDEEHAWEYSNFGMAVLGSILGRAYASDYEKTMIDFIRDDLGLRETVFGYGKGDLKGYWNWVPGDSFLAAGGLVSRIGDMLKFAEIEMNDIGYLQNAHTGRKLIGTPENHGLRLDAIGLGWVIDSFNGIIWHNGATGKFNSYIGIDKSRKIAVVVLANTAPGFRIPASVIGVTLLKTLQGKHTTN